MTNICVQPTEETKKAQAESFAKMKSDRLKKIRRKGYLRGLAIILIVACLPLYFVCDTAILVFIGGIPLYIWANLKLEEKN